MNMKFVSLSLPLLFVCSCAKGPDPVTPETPVERQMVGLLEKFDRWDENGDGYLNVTELRHARKVAGHEPKEILEFYDKNGDARISLKEAQGGLDRVDEAEKEVRR